MFSVAPVDTTSLVVALVSIFALVGTPILMPRIKYLRDGTLPNCRESNRSPTSAEFG